MGIQLTLTYSAFALTSLDLQGDFTNDEPICEWASILAKILQIIKYFVGHGPILDWIFICAKY